MPPGLISHSLCFAPLRYRSLQKTTSSQSTTMNPAGCMIFILIFVRAQTNCSLQISLISQLMGVIFLEMSSMQTHIHNDLNKNYRLQLHLFPPPHSRYSTTPHLHPEKHTAFNIHPKPHCLREIVEPKSIMKYEYEYMRKRVGAIIHQSCLTVISSRSAFSVVSAEVSVKELKSVSSSSSSTVLRNQINRHKDMKNEPKQSRSFISSNCFYALKNKGSLSSSMVS